MLAFLQRIGKALMLPIAALPVAALMLRLGQPDILNMPFIAAAGDALFSNLPVLFAVGVAVGLSVDQSGAAGLAGLVGYLVLDNATKAVWATMTAKGGIYDGQSFKMLAFGGIIAGIVAGLSYNKFHKTKLPEFLGFFGGRRFVPIITSLFMLVVSGISIYLWPYLQHGIDALGKGIVGLGAVGAGLFGFFNRLLIPFGLHHVLNSYFWFTLGEFGGKTGDLSRFFAGDPTAGIYMAGFYPVMMFGLPAVAFAIYCAAKKENKKAIAGMLISVAFTSFLTGITEPIEFMFIFLSPVLFVAHALITGISLFVTTVLGTLHGFGFSAGAIDFFLNMKFATRPWLIVPIGLAIAAVYFIIFYVAIVKFNIPTPGREEDDELTENNAILNKSTTEVAEGYIKALGGENNIVQVDNCTTRLRLVLVDSSKLDEKALKELGARGVIKLNKTSAQVIVGTNVEFVKDAIKEVLKTSTK